MTDTSCTPRYILALDQGTTSSRAILFDHQGAIAAVGQREFPQNFPRSGWVEHDPEEIWFSQEQAVRQALSAAGAKREDIAGVGITNQRETTLIWNRKTGKPLGNAIVWQDRRTADRCEHLKQAGHGPVIQEKTGLVVDSYFSATKLEWLLQTLPGARDLAEAGDAAFGTVDSWLIWKLTNGKLHVTDPTNAARTMLYNIHEGRWDEDLLKLFNIPRSVLPEVRLCNEVMGEISALDELNGLPLAGIAGDQQSALFGQACTRSGMAKNTYGTGCFLLMHTGSEPRPSTHKLLTTLALHQTGHDPEFALEGSVFIAGAVVQWLRDGLGIIRRSSEIEDLARKAPDNGGVYLVPAFAGLGAPHWDSYARGAVFGLNRGVTAAHLARAALESIAFQSWEILEAMQRDAGVPLRELRVDGGAASNDLLMQFQADLLQAPVVRPRITETTALGAAYLAGLATGFWSDREQIAAQWQKEKTFEPNMPEVHRAELIERWQNAVSRTGGWERKDNSQDLWTK